MKHLAALLACLTPALALANGNSWTNMVADPDPTLQVTGAILGCMVAIHDPAAASAGFSSAGWKPVEDYEGTVSFETSSTSVVYWDEPGFCMVETSAFNTQTVAPLLEQAGLTNAGTDADGCYRFSTPSKAVFATLSSGGNDPTCTSDTDAALRFELNQ